MEEPKILVGIRKRPLSKKEASKGDTDTVAVKNRSTVIVTEYKYKNFENSGKKLIWPSI